MRWIAAVFLVSSLIWAVHAVADAPPATLPASAHPDVSGEAPNNVPGESLTVSVPAPVKLTIQHELGNGTLLGVSLETPKSSSDNSDDPDSTDTKSPHYVAKALIGGSNYTITVMTDGSLVSKDCDDTDPPFNHVEISDLPDAVKSTLHSELGDGPISGVFKQDYQTVFEIHLTVAGRGWVIQIDQTGKLLSKDLDEDMGEDRGKAAT